MKDRERQRHRQREKQAPCREPDVGLDPGSPGSRPGLKAGSEPLSNPGIPNLAFYQMKWKGSVFPWLDCSPSGPQVGFSYPSESLPRH